MDSAGVDPLDDSDKEDNCINSQDDIEVKVRDTNMLTDMSNTNPNQIITNEPTLTYHQN